MNLVVMYGYQGADVDAEQLEAAWAETRDSQPAVTCKRIWESSGGNRRDFMFGCPLTCAAVHSCMVGVGGWLQPHLAFRACFDCQKIWRIVEPIQCASCGLLRGLLRG